MSKPVQQLKKLLDARDYESIKTLDLKIEITDDDEWLYNIVTAAYYIKELELGYQAFELLSRKMNTVGVPAWIIDGATRNVRWYLNSLGVKIKNFDTQDVPQIGSRLFSSNPSIHVDGSNVDVILRTVNYKQSKAMHYDIKDRDGFVRTFNRLQRYTIKNGELVLFDQKEIIDATPKSERIHFRQQGIEGLEDCRLFKFNGVFGFTCTMLDVDPIGQPRIALCQLTKNGLVIHIRHLIGPRGPGECEKNWLPFVYNNELLCIYDWNPITVLRICTADEWAAMELSREPDFLSIVCPVVAKTETFHGFRGSAAPIRYKDGWLAVTHQYGFDDGRNYYHRFVHLDPQFKMVAMSKMWFIDHIGVEFVSGLARQGRDFIMTFGIEDTKGCYATVTSDEIQNLLVQ